MTQTIDQTLAERGQRYGEFIGHAHITQNIKEAMKSHEGWDDLAPDMVECLEMVAHKIGRIINGDPEYIDSWTDIIGYTRLVEKRLIDEQTEGPDTCNNPECPVCHPEAAVEAGGPSHDEVRAALGVLLKAGVIKQAE